MPKAKQKQVRLNFKPTPISRLSKQKTPFPMVGDPKWGPIHGKYAWEQRSKAVYEYEMERKHWPMAWKPDTWTQAHIDNTRISLLMRRKWEDYLHALEDNWHYEYEAAERDNAAWDYEHENFLVA